MESIQNSAVEELPEPMSTDNDEHKTQKRTLNEEKPSIRTNKALSSPDTDKRFMLSFPPNTTTFRQGQLQQNKTKEEGHQSRLKTTSGFSHGNESSTSTSSETLEKSTMSTNATPTKSRKKKKYNDGATDDFNYPYQKYTREANLGTTGTFYNPDTGLPLSPTDDDWHELVHKRVRRASGISGSTVRREDNKNTCSLYIQTDPLIWRHIREGIADVSIRLGGNNLSYFLSFRGVW